jgi:hypothetical protein
MQRVTRHTSRIQKGKSIGLVLTGCALFVFFILTIIRVNRIPPDVRPFPDAVTHATPKDSTAVSDTLDVPRMGN